MEGHSVCGITIQHVFRLLFLPTPCLKNGKLNWAPAMAGIAVPLLHVDAQRRPEWQQRRLDSHGTLAVHVTSASGLSTSEWLGGAPNAYVIAELGGTTRKTSVATQRKNPIWSDGPLVISGKLRDSIEDGLLLRLFHEDGRGGLELGVLQVHRRFITSAG